MGDSILRQFVNWTKAKVKLHILQPIDFYFNEREVWWASLGKNIGFEQDGKDNKFERPVLVFKKFNKDVLWTLPMTSKKKKGKYYYNMEHEGKIYSIIISQLRLISSKRLTRKIRRISMDEFDEIKNKVRDIL